MSVDRSLYYGHYFLINDITVNHVEEADGCPTCLTKMSSKFCPVCGAECGDIEITETYSADLDEILEELGADDVGRSYREFITDTDMMHDGRRVCVLNYTNFYKGFGGFLSDGTFFLPKIETPELTTQGQYRLHDFLKAYKERYGEDSIETGIAMLQYYW